MSLCVSIYSVGQIYVFADGRISANSNGVDYLVTDTYPKARCIGDKVIFTTGMVAIAEQFFQNVKPTSTLREIERIARRVYNGFKSENEGRAEYKALEHGIEFGVAVHDITAGKARYTQLSYYNDFKADTRIPIETDVFAWGANSDCVLPEIERLFQIGGDITEIVKEAFGRVSDVHVGGKLHAFFFDGRNIIVPKDPLWIRSKTQYPAWPSDKVPSTADMAGNVVARSIKLTGEMTDSEVISTVIRASRIIGNEIEGGTITGTKIQTSDSVYPRVVIDPASVAFGVYSSPNDGILIPAYEDGVSKIRFLANGNESTIYNSPGVGLAISAFGNATITGSNIDLQPTSGRVRLSSWDKIADASGTTLQSELNALWSAIAGKASASHSHTVTIPSHNHGNPANANSGGGTFTAS
ncbi:MULTISPECIES: hypothetical protein [unclassified Paenibacillus]|uniref:hypothetical protein n=1 Tax=unclassified Paenibacillus TaxID=185978 RepID=UPI0030FCB142